MPNEVDKNEVFEYLDKLREAGDTNMFGAGPWIENEFEVDKKTAKKLLVEWMETFAQRHPEG